jgi:DNA-binding NtrC family response regulator
VSLVEGGDQSQVLAECLITLGTVLGERALIESEEVLSRAASLCAGLGDDTQEAHANDALLRILKTGKKLLSQISDQLRPLEYKMIKGALLRHNGVISRAALDLEMPYQTLIKKIQTQYQDLLPARRPIRNRRKSMLGSNSENLRKQ